MQGRSFVRNPEFKADRPFQFYIMDYKFLENQNEDEDTVADKKLKYAFTVFAGKVTNAKLSSNTSPASQKGRKISDPIVEKKLANAEAKISAVKG
jgi:hypothetical protein